MIGREVKRKMPSLVAKWWTKCNLHIGVYTKLKRYIQRSYERFRNRLKRLKFKPNVHRKKCERVIREATM
jgi:hypothetical protein